MVEVLTSIDISESEDGAKKFSILKALPARLFPLTTKHLHEFEEDSFCGVKLLGGWLITEDTPTGVTWNEFSVENIVVEFKNLTQNLKDNMKSR